MKESEILELKKSTSELKEAIISIVAILNKHKKGEVYFGIRDNGEVAGQSVSDATLREISKTISDNIEPKIFPKIENVLIEDKQCVYVNFEGKEVPYYAYGRAYIRTGTENKQISAKELENIILHKNKESMRWDNQICEEATLKDIDKKTIKNFAKLSENSKRLNSGADSVKKLIEKLGLSKNNKLKNSAILLFGKEPKVFFRNNIVKCGRFRGDEKEEFIDLRDFEGNLFDNLESSINFLKEHLRISAKIEGILRKEKWEIPLEAFREALINAMIHRDYTNSGFIYIKIYDTKIIISNPGELPVELNISDLYKEHESFLRNPLLAETFYYTGFIDVWGRGILNILRLLKENGLEKALFEQSSGYFRVIFNRPKEESGGLNEGLNEGLNLTMKSIITSPNIKAKEIAEQTKRPIKTIERHIKQLILLGKIERRGSKKTGGYWGLKKEK